jgi:hypothetical protein
VPDTVLPGDLDPGDVIAVDETAEELLVTAVRLGSGGFVLTVAPLRGGRPGPERQLTLTAGTPVRKRGRARVWLSAPRTRWPFTPMLSGCASMNSGRLGMPARVRARSTAID